MSVVDGLENDAALNNDKGLLWHLCMWLKYRADKAAKNSKEFV